VALLRGSQGLCLTLQLENDAELTAHIHQVKDLELQLKQSIEDDMERKSLEETMATQVKQLSEQVSSLRYQIQEKDSQIQEKDSRCSKLSEELQLSQEEVCVVLCVVLCVHVYSMCVCLHVWWECTCVQ